MPSHLPSYSGYDHSENLTENTFLDDSVIHRIRHNVVEELEWYFLHIDGQKIELNIRQVIERRVYKDVLFIQSINNGTEPFVKQRYWNLQNIGISSNLQRSGIE